MSQTAEKISVLSPSSGPTSAAARRKALTPVESSEPVWQPGASADSSQPTTSVLAAITAPALPPDREAEIIAILTRPLRPDENHMIGNNNRERELRAAFAKLAPIEAIALRRRLDCDRDADALAIAFRRLKVERRESLRAFLAEPRRSFG